MVILSILSQKIKLALTFAGSGVAEEVEFGAANRSLGAFDLFDRFNPRGIYGKDTLNTDTVGGVFEDSEISALATALDSNDSAVEGLETLFVLFFDLVVNFDGVTDGVLGVLVFE